MTPDSSAPPPRRFAPSLWPTLAAAFLFALFVAAGHWQWDKATAKKAQQAQYDALAAAAPVALPATPIAAGDAASWRYRRVVARGRYDAQRQILIDNRTHAGRAGYHVVTPLRLEGSATHVLVNRGWLPLPADRALPTLPPPAGTVEVVGVATLPAPFFTLGATSESSSAGVWQRLWQNLDLERFAAAVDFPLQPVIIEEDAATRRGDANDLVRAWRRPDARVNTNLSYALQWWAFAATTAGLWLYFSFRRRPMP